MQVALSVLLSSCVRYAEAGWGVWASSAASSAGSAVSSAASSAANQVSQSAGDLAAKGKDLSGSALENMERQACELKTWEDICSVNDTMSNQLRIDCESQAARSPFMHDNIYGSCITMGLYNINRTLEKQVPKIKEDCVKMLRDAPGDMAGTLAHWSERSQKMLTEKLGPSIHSAVGTAREVVVGGEAEQPEQDVVKKFNVKALHLVSGISTAYVSASLLLCLSLLASIAAGVFAWRRSLTKMTASEDGQLLALESEEDLII